MENSHQQIQMWIPLEEHHNLNGLAGTTFIAMILEKLFVNVNMNLIMMYKKALHNKI